MAFLAMTDSAAAPLEEELMGSDLQSTRMRWPAMGPKVSEVKRQPLRLGYGQNPRSCAPKLGDRLNSVRF